MRSREANVDADDGRRWRAGPNGRRIGVLRVGSLGDHLIALPVYRRLRERHRSDCLVLISNALGKSNVKLVGPTDILPRALFDEVHAYPVGSGPKTVVETFQLFRRLAIDLLYYAMPPRSEAQRWRDRAFFRVAGVPVIGLGADAARRAAVGSRPGTCEHETDRLWRGVRGGPDRRPIARSELSMELSGDEIAAARAAIGVAPRCAVTLSIGTKCEVNDWGLDNWMRLVAELSKLGNIDRLIMIGAADERASSEALRSKWPGAAINLCGALTPRVSAAVIAQSKLFVGHDSGPMHMAAAVGVPIVAVFSSRNLPGAWFPLSANHRVHYTMIECMGCRRVRCLDRAKECIRRISVAEVHASCVSLLGVG